MLNILDDLTKLDELCVTYSPVIANQIGMKYKLLAEIFSLTIKMVERRARAGGITTLSGQCVHVDLGLVRNERKGEFGFV